MEKFPSTFESNKENKQNINEELTKNLDWKEFSLKLKKLKNSMENIKEYNEDLLEANKLIREILKNPYENNLSLIEKTNKLLYKFSSPIYKESNLQRSYAKILSMIDLAKLVKLRNLSRLHLSFLAVSAASALYLPFSILFLLSSRDIVDGLHPTFSAI